MMLEMVDELLQRRLSSYDDKIAELVANQEELERRLRGIVRSGKVVAVQGGQLIKVKAGRNTTPWIKWLAPAMGKTREYRCPSIGEQVVLLNYGGGDNSTQAWALCGVPSDTFALPSSDPKKHRVEYEDSSFVEKDDESGDLVVSIKGDLVFDVEGEIRLKATSIKADKR